MFNFFKAECPVEENEKKWIEDSLAWFYSAARQIKFKDFQSISTNSYFASENIVLKEEHLYKIFDRVKKQMGFSEELTGEMHLYKDEELAFNEGLKTKSYSGQSFSHRGYIEDNKFVFTVNPEYLKQPVVVVAGMAYSLAFYKLQEEKNIKEITGYFNTLAATVLGFGAFQANSVISQNQWHGTTHYGWSVGARGFLTQQMYGYILALAAYLKKENKPEWSNELCRDVKAYFERATKFIRANPDYYSRYEKGIAENAAAAADAPPPDYYHVHKFYEEQRRLTAVSEMKNSIKHGITTYYHKNGALWEECEYKNGLTWNVAFIYNNKSKPVEVGTLKDGNGTLYSYYESDKLAYMRHFENGEIIKQENFKNGEFLSSVVEMKNGCRNGITTHYHSDGSLWAKWEYKENVPWTAICNYDRKGKAVEHGDLKEGNGTLFSYDEQGALLYKYHYENGKLINTEKF